MAPIICLLGHVHREISGGRFLRSWVALVGTRTYAVIKLCCLSRLVMENEPKVYISVMQSCLLVIVVAE